MINILNSGRLGNKLFQFAFGLSISKKLKMSFIFNTNLRVAEPKTSQSLAI